MRLMKGKLAKRRILYKFNKCYIIINMNKHIKRNNAQRNTREVMSYEHPYTEELGDILWNAGVPEADLEWHEGSFREVVEAADIARASQEVLRAEMLGLADRVKSVYAKEIMASARLKSCAPLYEASCTAFERMASNQERSPQEDVAQVLRENNARVRRSVHGMMHRAGSGGSAPAKVRTVY